MSMDNWHETRFKAQMLRIGCELEAMKAANAARAARGEAQAYDEQDFMNLAGQATSIESELLNIGG